MVNATQNMSVTDYTRSPCAHLLLPPSTVVCSGQGRCSVAHSNDNTSRGWCVCTGPWSSRGDFRYEEGIDCDIHPGVMLLLYSLAISGMGFALALCMYHIVCYVRRDRRTVWTSGPFIIHCLVFCTTLLHSIFDALKIYDPLYFSVGLEPISTWIMAFANVFLFLFGSVMTNGLFQISLQQLRFTGRYSTKRLLHVLRKLVPVFFVCLCVTQFLSTIGGLYDPSIGERYLFAAVVVSSGVFTSYAFFVPLALKHILADLKQSMDQAKETKSHLAPSVVAMHQKLRDLQFQFFFQPILNGIVNLTVALCPFILRR